MLNKKKLFWIGIFVYVIFFILFYPKFFSIADETAYLKQTHHLFEGKILVDDVFDSYYYVQKDSAFAPSYQVGNSVILMPFVLLGWKFVFFSGLIFHLLNFYILIRIFRKYNIRKIYALFYLFYPGLIFYSRTVMGEIVTITFTLLGFYYFLRNSKPNFLLAGFLWGISCLIRPTNALIIVGMSFPIVYKAVKNLLISKKFVNNHFKQLIYIGIGVLPSLLLVLLFNYIAYGGILNSRYSGGGIGIYNELILFSINQLIIYWKPICIMLLIYPLMLISPFFGKYKKKSGIICTLLLFILILGKIDAMRYNWIINLIIGHRYFFTVIPLLLIPYSLFIDKYLRRWVPISLIFLFMVSPILMYNQSQYTDTKYDVMQQIYEIIPEDSLIVVNSGSQYLNNYFGENYKVVRLFKFEELNYLGKFYLVSYVNKVLTNDLKEKDKQKDNLINQNKLISNYIQSHNLNLIYNKNNLVIYSGIGSI